MSSYNFHGNKFPYSNDSIERFLLNNRSNILNNLDNNNIDYGKYAEWVERIFKFNVNKINFFDDTPYSNFSNLARVVYDNSFYILDKFVMNNYIKPAFFKTIGSTLIGAPIFVVNSVNSVGSTASCVNTELNYLYRNNLYTGNNIDKAINYCTRANIIELFGLGRDRLMPTMTIAESIYLSELRKEKIYVPAVYATKFNENFDNYLLIPLGYVNHFASKVIGTSYDLATAPIFYVSQGVYNYVNENYNEINESLKITFFLNSHGISINPLSFYFEYKRLREKYNTEEKNKDNINRIDYVMSQIEEQYNNKLTENKCIVNWDKINEEVRSENKDDKKEKFFMINDKSKLELMLENLSSINKVLDFFVKLKFYSKMKTLEAGLFIASSIDNILSYCHVYEMGNNVLSFFGVVINLVNVIYNLSKTKIEKTVGFLIESYFHIPINSASNLISDVKNHRNTDESLFRLILGIAKYFYPILFVVEISLSIISNASIFIYSKIKKINIYGYDAIANFERGWKKFKVIISNPFFGINESSKDKDKNKAKEKAIEKYKKKFKERHLQVLGIPYLDEDKPTTRYGKIKLFLLNQACMNIWKKLHKLNKYNRTIIDYIMNNSEEDIKEDIRLKLLGIKKSFYEMNKNKNPFTFISKFFKILSNSKNRTEFAINVYSFFWRNGKNIKFSNTFSSILKFFGINPFLLQKYINSKNKVKDIDNKVNDAYDNLMKRYKDIIIDIKNSSNNTIDNNMLNICSRYILLYKNEDGIYTRNSIIRWANFKLLETEISTGYLVGCYHSSIVSNVYFSIAYADIEYLKIRVRRFNYIFDKINEINNGFVQNYIVSCTSNHIVTTIGLTEYGDKISDDVLNKVISPNVNVIISFMYGKMLLKLNNKWDNRSNKERFFDILDQILRANVTSVSDWILANYEFALNFSKVTESFAINYLRIPLSWNPNSIFLSLGLILMSRFMKKILFGNDNDNYIKFLENNIDFEKYEKMKNMICKIKCYYQSKGTNDFKYIEYQMIKEGFLKPKLNLFLGNVITKKVHDINYNRQNKTEDAEKLRKNYEYTKQFDFKFYGRDFSKFNTKKSKQKIPLVYNRVFYGKTKDKIEIKENKNNFSNEYIKSHYGRSIHVH